MKIVEIEEIYKKNQDYSYKYMYIIILLLLILYLLSYFYKL
jgi:hypothetical protein